MPTSKISASQMNCKFIRVVTALIVLGLNSFQYCSAQAACNGVLTGTFNNGVMCVGGNDCTLNGATVSGNVVCPLETLEVLGNSVITGNVLLSGQVTRAELDAVTVFGAVQVTDAAVLNELVITEVADVGPVSVNNAPNAIVRVSGTLQGLDLTNSGDLIANNLMANASVTVRNTNGLIEICDSFLGSLLVEQHTGNIEINSNAPNCGPTTLNGGLNAIKGFGQVRLIGASLPSGDLSISEYTGDIVVQDIPIVSDIKSEKNTGSLTISNVSADSDTIITEHVGDIVIEEFNTAGDFTVTGINGRVTLQDSKFDLEDISVVAVTGNVTILRNSDLSLTVENNSGEVTVTDNTVTNGNINKNTGGVVIINNTFILLSCTDNVPAPIGSGNTITFGDGQCSSGL